MITAVAVVASVAVIGYVMLWILNRTPARHRNLTPSRMHALLNALLVRGIAGSRLIIDVVDTDWFLQFRLDGPPGARKIVSHFPIVDWSETFFSSLIETLKSEHFAYRQITDAGIDSVYLEFGTDTAEATRYALAVLSHVFHVDAERDVVARLFDVREFVPQHRS